MREYTVVVCYDWDGKDRVCDSARCEGRLGENNMACYHKPIKINDELFTVIGALEKILTENKGQNSVGINRQQYTVIEAIGKMFMISQEHS